MDGLEEKYPPVPSRVFLSFLLHVDAGRQCAQLADCAERPEDRGRDAGTTLRIIHTSYIPTRSSSYLPITGHH